MDLMKKEIDMRSAQAYGHDRDGQLAFGGQRDGTFTEHLVNRESVLLPAQQKAGGAGMGMRSVEQEIPFCFRSLWVTKRLTKNAFYFVISHDIYVPQFM